MRNVNMKNHQKILKNLSKAPEKSKVILGMLDWEISLPNFPMPTSGGKIWWTTIAEVNGWKWQQNMLTKSARILDSDDVRIAWGTMNGMKKTLNRILAGREWSGKK